MFEINYHGEILLYLRIKTATLTNPFKLIKSKALKQDTEHICQNEMGT